MNLPLNLRDVSATATNSYRACVALEGNNWVDSDDGVTKKGRIEAGETGKVDLYEPGEESIKETVDAEVKVCCDHLDCGVAIQDGSDWIFIPDNSPRIIKTDEEILEDAEGEVHFEDYDGNFLGPYKSDGSEEVVLAKNIGADVATDILAVAHRDDECNFFFS